MDHRHDRPLFAPAVEVRGADDPGEGVDDDYVEG
jgi:hypothetical protein